METDANQLARAACEGDTAAGGRLVELFYRRIYAFLRRLAGNEADAADLTQRTFDRVWRALPTFAGRSSLGCWMHGIAYHVYVDWRRDNSRMQFHSDHWWLARVDSEAPPDEAASRNDMHAALYTSVDGLEAALRETVHLHYYQGLTLQETADAMGVAASTVKYRLRSALAQLQRKLASDAMSLKASTIPGTI
jgi:RNA polymerase sigma-70 factor, ECF subfamily